MIRLFIVSICLLLGSNIWAQEKQWPDGQWNGKPWKKHHLLAEVKKGNADALAEWVYCAYNALSRIEYDPKLMFLRAKQSNKGGSILGKRMLGRFYYFGKGTTINKQQGFKLIKEAAEIGLPDALLDMAIYYILGNEVDVDAQRAKTLLDRAHKYNSFRYNSTMSIYYKMTEEPHFNLKKSAHYSNLAIIKDGNHFACRQTRYNHYFHPSWPINRYYSEEAILRAHTVIEQGVALNNAMDSASQGFYECKRGDVNRGIALMLRAANFGEPLAHRILAQWMRNGARNQDYNIVAVGAVDGSAKAAVLAYELGERNKTVRYCYAESITLQLKKNMPVDRLNLAESIYIELLAEGYPSAAGQYGQFLARRYTYLNEDKSYYDRGMSLLIYFSEYNPVCEHLMAIFYLKRDKTLDIIKGVATTTSSVKRNKGAWKKFSSSWLKQAQPKLTPEQKGEVNQLITLGFPHSDHFRKVAFKHLQESGDIPKDWEYGQVRPKE